jgi:hypothetical protein
MLILFTILETQHLDYLHQLCLELSLIHQLKYQFHRHMLYKLPQHIWFLELNMIVVFLNVKYGNKSIINCMLYILRQQKITIKML